MNNKYKWICGTIIIIFAMIGWFGIFWTLNLSNASFDININMEEELKSLLENKDYCIFSQDNITFIGDCSYVDELIKGGPE